MRIYLAVYITAVLLLTALAIAGGFALYRASGPDDAAEAAAADDGDRLPQIENEVEDVIEGRVTAVLEDEGLALEPPLFSDLGLVFPPVDFELDASPRVLAISPRERIELRDSYLLTPHLDADQIQEIEREAEAENSDESGVSALVIRTGGFSSYP